MQVPLRAALHLDWVPSQLSGNRYAEAVTVYYTLAWFDRYVRGPTEPDVAADAFDRLTATEFDDSADRHNISQGIFDPDLAEPDDPYAGNVPYRIDGSPVADRLSFYFRAKCSLTTPGSSDTVTSDDIRTDGCAAPDGAASPPREGQSTAASDAGSSSSVTTMVAIVAVAVVLLLVGGLLVARRRSARDTAETGGSRSKPASDPPGTDRRSARCCGPRPSPAGVAKVVGPRRRCSRSSPTVHPTASGPFRPRLLDDGGIPAEGGHRERIQLASCDDMGHVVTRSHPLIARHRLALAATAALVDLVAQGTADEVANGYLGDVGLRDWQQRRADRRWQEIFQARIHEGEDLLIVTPCTFGTDPLDRRMVALTDDALYLCAVPPKGAFVGRIPYAEITSVDNSRVTRVDIERDPGSPVTLKAISTQEFIHVLKGHLPPPEATWTSFRGFRS
jgi:hypothetical protein